MIDPNLLKAADDKLKSYVSAYEAYRIERQSFACVAAGVAKCARQSAGLSIRKFAAVLNVSPSYLSKVERGVEVMSPELAKVLLER